MRPTKPKPIRYGDDAIAPYWFVVSGIAVAALVVVAALVCRGFTA